MDEVYCFVNGIRRIIHISYPITCSVILMGERLNNVFTFALLWTNSSQFTNLGTNLPVEQVDKVCSLRENVFISNLRTCRIDEPGLRRGSSPLICRMDGR